MTISPQQGAMARYNERKRELIRVAKSVPCYDCKGVYPTYVMDLHHIDPKDKSFHASQYQTIGYDRLIAEIAKCIALCANCHRIRTYQHLDTYDYKYL